jgi:hypothetical protein
MAEQLPARLLAAYRATSYEVAGVTLRIGRRSSAVDRLLADQRVQAAVFLSAHNPYSHRMAAGWNRRMQSRLCRSIGRRQKFLCGVGSLRHWSEDHVLVFGDPRPALRLARRFRQNGVVVLRRGQAPRLLTAF